MMTNSFRLILLCVWLPVLSACGDGTYSDLDDFVRDSGKDLRGRVTALPEMKHYEHFQYAAFDNPDPFLPRKADIVKSSGANQPDMQRRRETLEGFSLESLKMVGSLNQKEVTYALILAPDSTVHRIRSGAYLGQNFGMVIDISESEVKLKEIVQDSNADWVERVSTLMLEDQEQNK